MCFCVIWLLNVKVQWRVVFRVPTPSRRERSRVSGSVAKHMNLAALASPRTVEDRAAVAVRATSRVRAHYQRAATSTACDAATRINFEEIRVPGISAVNQQCEFAEAEATVARLASLVHSPPLDNVNPASHEFLIALSHEIKEASP